MLVCKICDNTVGNTLHTAREMMFGLREEFEYLECGRCGCVQLLNVPEDLSKYYPQDYYSFGEADVEDFNPLRTMIRRQKHDYCLHGRNPLGRLLVNRAGIPTHFSWLRGGKVNFDSAILDVGCGTGSFLSLLSRDGFSCLMGADPFIERDIVHESGVTIWKKTIAEVDQQFDFVIMNHAFEHMAEPLVVLQEVQRVLKPDRYALIRIPVASSYAWRKYGVHWSQLDAPRHLYLHTRESMKRLAERAGLELAGVFYDSNSLQFTGSEKYLKDIPLTDAAGQSLFTEADVADFERQAEELNRQQQGDQAGFYLRKAETKAGRLL